MKYKFSGETKEFFGKTLHRIEALKDFADVKKGEKGGFIENESNLSQEDNSWVYDNAIVYNNALVENNAAVRNNAVISNAYIKNAYISNAIVRNNAVISNAVISNANISNANISNTYISNANINNADVHNTNVLDAMICDYTDIFCISGIGSRLGTTAIYRNKNGGLSVSSGCFVDDLEEFRNLVEEIYGDNRLGKEYNTLISLAEIHFNQTEEKK